MASCFALEAWGQTSAGSTAERAKATDHSAVKTVTRTRNHQCASLIANTEQGKREFDAMQKKYEPAQAELKKSNDEIDTLKKQLDASRSVLSPGELAQRGKALQDKEGVFQRKYEKWQSDLAAEQNVVGTRIWQKVLPVLVEYAVKGKGYTVIVDVSGPNSPVLWASAKNDITQAVIDAYNAKQAGNAAGPPPSRCAKTHLPSQPAEAPPTRIPTCISHQLPK